MDGFEPTSDPLVDIPAFIKWRGDHVTFIELLKGLPYLRGERAIYFGDDEKILWEGVSQKCIDGLGQLTAEGKIFQWLCSPIVYVANGGGLHFPLVKGPQKYKRPHWMPVTFALRPPTEAQLRSIAQNFISAAA